MATPLVSVLMSAYNAAATLEATLQSLQAQTLDDFEVVAVDDGSADATRKILETWQKNFPPLRLIAAEHRGLIPALNQGLGLCRGRFVARMDADDLAHPQRLEKQVLLLEQQPDISVVGSLVETFPREDVREGLRIYEEWLNQLVSHEDISREIFIESPIANPSAMVRRREILELGSYCDHGWPEDYDLWLRYFVAGRRFAKVPEVLLSWREHPQRVTHTDSRYSVENFLRAKAFYLIQGPLRENRDLIVWGAGKTGRRLSKHLIRGGHTPQAFVDIAAAKIGKSLRGVPIIGVSELPALWRQLECPVLLAAVASRGARALIRAELARLQLVEARDFWCVA
jgi:glycosyltransferase involved in cell wall biosynthesis